MISQLIDQSVNESASQQSEPAKRASKASQQSEPAKRANKASQQSEPTKRASQPASEPASNQIDST